MRDLKALAVRSLITGGTHAPDRALLGAEIFAVEAFALMTRTHYRASFLAFARLLRDAMQFQHSGQVQLRQRSMTS